METQSTTRADLYLKPKTDAQIAAIPNATPGMVAFSSDQGKMVVNEVTGWSAVNAVTGVRYAKVNLTTAQMQGMSAAPVVILAAPGAASTYVIHGLKFTISYAGALLRAEA